MKEIQLTQGQVALVDDDVFEELNQHKWYAIRQRNTFYAVRHSLTINGERHIIWMHHEIIGYPLKNYEVDHRNGQDFDNQRHNLRFVTRRQNNQNRKNQKMSSKYPGVSWDKSRQKWQAKITTNGIQKHLGRFLDEFEAFNIYRQAVNDLGETMIEEWQNWLTG